MNEAFEKFWNEVVNHVELSEMQYKYSYFTIWQAAEKATALHCAEIAAVTINVNKKRDKSEYSTGGKIATAITAEFLEEKP